MCANIKESVIIYYTDLVGIEGLIGIKESLSGKLQKDRVLKLPVTSGLVQK